MPITSLGRVPRVCLGACAVALATIAGAGSWAAASRAPSSAERAIIVKTVKSSKLTAAVPSDSYDVRAIRIATVSTPGRRYARVTLAPRPGVTRDGATGVVRRLRGHWRLVDLGTAGVGCRLPAAVRDDLGLQCP